MSYKQMTGNIISATKVEPNGNKTNSSASGVWSLQEAYDYTRGSNWPNVSNLAASFMKAGRPVSSSAISAEFITISTTGNSVDWNGDLTVERQNGAGCGSEIRAVFAGGYNDDTNAEFNTIDYFTWATRGNAADFGDLSSTGVHQKGLSTTTRGVIGGSGSSGDDEVIDFVTIASAGNAADFGDLTVGRQSPGGLSSTTRGLFAGGWNNSSARSDVIDYITVASAGNATDFGNLSVATSGTAGGVNSATRGVFAGGFKTSGGNAYINVMQYVTIASVGNTSDFGDLTGTRNQMAGGSSLTRGVYAGGNSEGAVNIIDYITIASTGNAADFGDLLNAHLYPAGSSNAHGGLVGAGN